MGYIPPYPIGGSGGALPQPFDYTLYKSGSDCKILNNSTGVVDSTNTHADVPIQAAIDALASGVAIYVCPGVYSVYAPVESDNKSVSIIGGTSPGRGVNPAVYPIAQFKATATLGANFVFDFGLDGYNAWGSTLRNLAFYGAERTDTLGAIRWANQFLGCLDNIFISNFYNEVTPAIGIDLTNKGVYNCNFNDLFRIHIWDTPIAIHVDSLANCNTIYSGRLQNGRHETARGIQIDGCDTLQVFNIELISYDEANSIALYIVSGGVHRFIGTRFEANRVNVQIDNGSGRSYFTNCSLGTADVTNVIDNSATKALFWNCYNYITEKWGSSTGTGAQQTIAHGLAGTPTLVLLSDKELNAIPYQSAAADATNIYITAALNQDYQWYARLI